MMSCRTCLAVFPCHRRNPLLQHHLGQLLTAHLDLRHIYRPRLSMTAELLLETHLVLLPLRHNPQPRILPTFTMATGTFPRSSRQPRVIRPSATLAFVLKSVLILPCFNKMRSRVSHRFLILPWCNQTASLMIKQEGATGQHQMRHVQQALPCQLISKALIRGARLASSRTSVVLTLTRQGVRGLDLDLDLDPSLTKQSMALLHLHRNLLQP
jgi:hypothetical protein